MYTYEMWDKKSRINGVEAEEILNKSKFLKDGDVFLVFKNGVVINIESINIIKTLDFKYSNMTNEEIASDYVKNLDISVEDKISILEAENADLLLDSAIKDSKISTLENDLADLTLEIAMMEVR